jgi:hypothetical protein
MLTVSVVNDPATRERLSATAIRGFLRLAEVWRLRADEQIDLLGGSVSRSTLHNWTRGAATTTLNADQLARVSYLLAIYEGLQRIWRRAPQEADAWIRRPRVEEPFRGQTPLALMREGGIIGLASARAYVDGMTGGPPSRAEYPAPPREAV